MMSSFVLQGKTAMSYSLGLKYMLDFGLLNFFIFGVTEQAVPSTHDRIEHLDGLLQGIINRHHHNCMHPAERHTHYTGPGGQTCGREW